MKTNAKTSQPLEAYAARWNKRVLEYRQALIRKITALHPTIKEDKLLSLADADGNLALEEVLTACEKIADLI